MPNSSRRTSHNLVAVPKAFAKSNRFGVPATAAMAVSIGAAVISCFPSFTEEIVGFGTLFAAVTISINIVSLYVARRRNPSPEGIFKAPGGSILPAVALALIIACYIPDIISGGWVIWAYTIAWYALGYALFKVGSKRWASQAA